MYTAESVWGLTCGHYANTCSPTSRSVLYHTTCAGSARVGTGAESWAGVLRWLPPPPPFASGPGELRGIGGPVLISAPVSLDLAINQDLRNKIWANEYVDFGSLLDPSQMTHNKVVVQQTGGGGSSLCLIPPSKMLPKNINEWQTAFAIFTTVYTKKFTDESNNLVKYGETIRQMAKEGGDFNSYDVTFRKLRQVANLPWYHFHTELYLKASTFGKRSEPFQPNTQYREVKQFTKSTRLPFGYCFRFCRGLPCDGFCDFKHKCTKCMGNHPMFSCKFKIQPTMRNRREFASTVPAETKASKQASIQRDPIHNQLTQGAGRGQGFSYQRRTYTTNK